MRITDDQNYKRDGAKRIGGNGIEGKTTCSQQVKEAAYKGLVRPVLEYSGSVWDPSGVDLQNELEKNHNRAAKFITGNHCNFETGSMTDILGHLKW